VPIVGGITDLGRGVAARLTSEIGDGIPDKDAWAHEAISAVDGLDNRLIIYPRINQSPRGKRPRILLAGGCHGGRFVVERGLIL
jgi:hypothetical protein